MMKFICDSMLGKLAKKLRMLGLDTAYHITAAEKKIITVALKENRIILTRKTNFPVTDKNIPSLFIVDNGPEQQIRQVVSHYNINRSMLKPFNICISCNTELRPLKKELAEGKVADYVFNTSEHFSECTTCKKIFWIGTHYQNMTRSIDNIFI